MEDTAFLRRPEWSHLLSKHKGVMVPLQDEIRHAPAAEIWTPTQLPDAWNAAHTTECIGRCRQETSHAGHACMTRIHRAHVD